jgi:uncharacterized protein YdhG (YjbR/CyaY superfamily)
MAAGRVTVDEYITSFPEETQAVLTHVRRILREVVPEAEEKISYGMPTLTVDGRYLVYFAGWESHVSFYPLPEGDPVFEAAIAPYRSGKGTARFPLKDPIPADLIRRLVSLLVDGRRNGA